MAKYKNDTYNKGYFCQGSTDDIKLITCKDKICIPYKFQSYVLH